MKLYCTEAFKDKIRHLRKHKALVGLLAAHYCNAAFEQTRQGHLLMAIPPNDPDVLLVKKRLGGDGGYRVYVSIRVKEQIVCLGAVHPKTGSHAVDNLSTAEIAMAQKQVIAALARRAVLYEVSSPDGETLDYRQV